DALPRQAWEVRTAVDTRLSSTNPCRESRCALSPVQKGPRSFDSTARLSELPTSRRRQSQTTTDRGGSATRRAAAEDADRKTRWSDLPAQRNVHFSKRGPKSGAEDFSP